MLTILFVWLTYYQDQRGKILLGGSVQDERIRSLWSVYKYKTGVEPRGKNYLFVSKSLHPENSWSFRHVRRKASPLSYYFGYQILEKLGKANRWKVCILLSVSHWHSYAGVSFVPIFIKSHFEASGSCATSVWIHTDHQRSKDCSSVALQNIFD